MVGIIFLGPDGWRFRIDKTAADGRSEIRISEDAYATLDEAIAAGYSDVDGQNCTFVGDRADWWPQVDLTWRPPSSA